ncbi:YtxH domain-containing protein [Paenibacillus sepulcri]
MGKLNRRSSFMFGAVAGSILGSVTALLLAPKAGKELRRDISDGTRQVTDRTVRVVTHAGDSTARIVKQVGSKAAILSDKAKDTAGSVIGSISSWRGSRKDELLEGIDLPEFDNTKEALKETLEEAKEEIQTIR